ncbi:unnamed protein product [Lymnaea stagnalis]|uniref:Uncharacterized protein n=1 Tax=Lymnaea stagnalis TaxID=6523 RepID=A0AAV2I7F3_LYMST
MSEAILCTDMDIQSWRSSSQRSDCESLARLIEVEKRVKEIYKERQGNGTDNTDGNTGDSDASYIEMAIKGDNLDSSIQNVKGRFQPEKIVKRNSTDLQKDPMIVKSFISQIDFQDKKLDLSSSKTDLTKTFSADSAKTDLSMKTNTSGLSSTYSHQSDTSDHAVLDNASLHDSGFVQLSGPGSESTEHSLNTSLQEDGHKNTVLPSPLESGADNNNLPPSSQPMVDYGTRQGSRDDPSTQVSRQGPWSHETGNENYEMRQTRRSEDSGVSSLNERIGDDLKVKSESFIHKVIVKGNAEFVNNLKNIEGGGVSTKSLESHISGSLEHYSNSDLKIAGDQISATERIKNGQSVFSNGRSVSEESNKTNESDDVFQDCEGKQDVVGPQQQVMPHQVEDGKQAVDTWVKGQKVVFNNDVVSDQPQQVVCDNTVTQESQDSLSNGFHVGLDQAEHSSHTKDIFQRQDSESLEEMESPNVQTLATKFEPKPVDNSFLRRTQSLKKNFKVDSKFSVVKSTPLINGENFSDSSHEEQPSLDEGNLNIPGESGSEQTLSGNSQSPSDDTIHMTSSESSVDKQLSNEAPRPAADINLNDEELYSASRSHQKLYRLSLSIGSTQETTDQLSAAALQLDKELSHSRPIMSSESLSYTHVSRMEQPTNIAGSVSADSGSPELEPTKTSDDVLQTGNVDNLSKVNCKQAPINIPRGKIDTKFYGDSDEDTSVHEARVQSFKDSYKRLSAANSKFKLLNDVIQENANGPVSKPGSKIQIPPSKEISGSSATNELRTSADLVHPASISLSSSKPSLENIGRKSSEASIIWDNVQSRDPDAQWRLDYTNIHVDTDIESLAMSSASCDGQGGGEGGDSQPPSRRLSCFSNGSDMKDQRLNQFLRDTASSFSSQFGQSSEEDKQMGFLSTSMLSGCNSVSWSSYDEISTPPQGDGDSVKYRLPRTRAYNMESRTTSIASTIDMYGSTDLSLLSKNKISDKPVKWLVATESQGKPVVLSFSGSHSDDEAVLIWSREANETLWTNAPVLEYNPTTRMATLPSYMRPQLSNSASARTSPHIRLTSQNSN